MRFIRFSDDCGFSVKSGVVSGPIQLRWNTQRREALRYRTTSKESQPPRCRDALRAFQFQVALRVSASLRFKCFLTLLHELNRRLDGQCRREGAVVVVPFVTVHRPKEQACGSGRCYEGLCGSATRIAGTDE